jgi:hypothetical protein
MHIARGDFDPLVAILASADTQRLNAVPAPSTCCLLWSRQGLR